MENKKPIITEKDVKKVKSKIKETAIDNVAMTEQEKALFDKCLAEAKLPVVLEDKDFKLGEQELDIRKLCPSNYDQMTFRLLSIQTGMLRTMAQSLVDIQRIMLLICKTMGVKDIVGELDTLINELSALKETKIKDMLKAKEETKA